LERVFEKRFSELVFGKKISKMNQNFEKEFEVSVLLLEYVCLIF